MQSPTFSVLIAAYNGEASLPQALDSLLAQTRSDWEAIVVDDGSVDGTAAVARGYAAADPRVRVVTKANGGTSSARNAGAKLAEAPFLCILDQDDALLPHYFERMGILIAEHPGFEIYSCNAIYQYGDGTSSPRNDPSEGIRSYTLAEMLEGCHIHPQAIVRRSTFEMVGGFDENPLCWTEDYDLWLRAMARGARHIYTSEVLAVYHWSSTHKSSQTAACAASDAYIFKGLLAGGGLAEDVRPIVERRYRQLVRNAAALEDPARREFEDHMARGDFQGFRRRYLKSRRGWASPLKYWAGMPFAMVSPRRFAAYLGDRRRVG